MKSNSMRALFAASITFIYWRWTRKPAEWFARVINSESPAELGSEKLGNYNVKVDNVTMHVLPDTRRFKPKERHGAIQPTDGVDAPR